MTNCVAVLYQEREELSGGQRRRAVLTRVYEGPAYLEATRLRERVMAVELNYDAKLNVRSRDDLSKVAEIEVHRHVMAGRYRVVRTQASGTAWTLYMEGR